VGEPSRRSFVQSIAGGSLLSRAEFRAFGKDSIPLIVPGKRSGSIFLSPDASLSEKWAAEQLSLHLERMTGIRLPIVTGGKIPESPAVAVGRSSFTDKYRLEIPEGESCLLKTEGGTLIIAGGRQRGTMYGVFCFLEKLGCRWFTGDVARVPAIRGLSVPPLDEISRPAFEYREVFFTEAQGQEWSARNRLNGHSHRLDETVGGKISYIPFAHSFYDLIPPGQYFGTHPEYFALVAGQRRSHNAQLCLTNAEVVDLAANRVQKWLTEHPGVSIASVSQNDGAGWCECDPCQRVVRNEGGAVSGALLRFVNRIAQRVAQSHPEKMIDTLAYQRTADPPAAVRPGPNVQIRLCPIDACQAHSYTTCVYNRNFKEQLSQWARIAPKLWLWQYSINFAHFLLPFPNEEELISDIPRFRRAGVSGIFVEGAVSEGGGGENAELRSYLAARLLWNPEVDVHAEIRGFFNAVYGPAAPLMWRYFVLRYRENGPSEHLWIDQNMDARYVTDRFLKDARDLLNRANRKAETGPPRRRIERCLLSLDYVETMRRRRCRLQGAFYGPDDPVRVRLETRNFVRKAETLGITHLREGYPLSAQAEDLNQPAAAYSVVALDDGALAVKIVPELGARVVALGPSGGAVNVLRVPEPGEFAYPHAGGLYFSLASSYLSNPQPVTWRAGPAAKGVVSLRGQSDRGVDLEMEIRLDSGIVSVRFAAANRGPAPLPAVIRCQAEFAIGPSRNADLRYTTQAGAERNHRVEAGDRPVDGNVLWEGGERPAEQWTLISSESPPGIRNRFHTDEVAQCGIKWSFRAAPRLIMSLWSPEVMLAPGQEVRLESRYELV
jgi:uncharacterized protein DUF4838